MKATVVGYSFYGYAMSALMVAFRFIFFDEKNEFDIVDEEEDLSSFTQDFIDNFVASAGFQLAKAEGKKSKKEKKKQQGPEKSVPDVKMPKKRRNIRAKDLLRFERDGHVAARSLLLEEEVYELRRSVLEVYENARLEAYRQKCDVLDLGAVRSIDEAEEKLATLAPEAVPFLQLFNLRKKSKQIKIPDALYRAAADLLGATRLRIYQDSVRITIYNQTILSSI